MDWYVHEVNRDILCKEGLSKNKVEASFINKTFIAKNISIN